MGTASTAVLRPPLVLSRTLRVVDPLPHSRLRRGVATEPLRHVERTSPEVDRVGRRIEGDRALGRALEVLERLGQVVAA